MSLPDHEIEVGPWPDWEGADAMRRCENCIHWGPEPSRLLALDTKTRPCGYPMPEFMATFFQLAANVLATDGTRCPVHQLEGEMTCHK
jgi:hypothetical protein